eukprot:1162151-Pelagomonas_calceolata.AAC.13
MLQVDACAQVPAVLLMLIVQSGAVENYAIQEHGFAAGRLLISDNKANQLQSIALLQGACLSQSASMAKDIIDKARQVHQQPRATAVPFKHQLQFCSGGMARCIRIGALHSKCMKKCSVASASATESNGSPPRAPIVALFWSQGEVHQDRCIAQQMYEKMQRGKRISNQKQWQSPSSTNCSSVLVTG